MLAAASLTKEEWRDILATTRNKLEYEKIADALATLWDEQLMRSFNNHWVEQAVGPWYNQYAAWVMNVPRRQFPLVNLVFRSNGSLG